MAEYIEREAALQKNMFGNVNSITYRTYAEILINSIPAVDVVEVVRCKDCEYWRKFDSSKVGICRESHVRQKRKANDFCSCGKRKE